METSCSRYSPVIEVDKTRFVPNKWSLVHFHVSCKDVQNIQVVCILLVVCYFAFGLFEMLQIPFSQGTLGCTPNSVPMVFIVVFCGDSWGL